MPSLTELEDLELQTAKQFVEIFERQENEDRVFKILAEDARKQAEVNRLIFAIYGRGAEEKSHTEIGCQRKTT